MRESAGGAGRSPSNRRTRPPAAPDRSVGVFEAAFLGLVQGLTEFLPVSSSGHLVLLQAWLGIDQEGVLFEVAVHVATLVSVLVFYRRLPNDARLSAAALGGILGGAIGNLVDRVMYGEVIDWLDFHIGSYTWPTFNVADSCIVVGVCVLILEVFMNPEDAEGDERLGDREQTSV